MLPMTEDTSGKGLSERLQRALLDAFPTRASLDQMLQFGLNRRLNEIAAENLNLTDTTAEVIDHLDLLGQWPDLIEAAREHNPDNPTLQDLVKDLPPPSTVVRVRRKAHHYPWHALAALLGITVGLAALLVTMTKAELTETELRIVKGVVGVAAA